MDDFDQLNHEALTETWWEIYSQPCRSGGEWTAARDADRGAA